jgi:hypothetical protein
MYICTTYNKCVVNLHINNKRRNIDTYPKKTPHYNINVDLKKVVPPASLA